MGLPQWQAQSVGPPSATGSFSSLSATALLAPSMSYPCLCFCCLPSLDSVPASWRKVTCAATELFPECAPFHFWLTYTSAVFFFSDWVGPASHTYLCLVRIEVRCSPQMFTAVLGYCHRRPWGRSVQDSHTGFFFIFRVPISNMDHQVS